MRSCGADGIADRLAFVTAEIVEDDDLAFCQRWHQNLLDIEGEKFPIDGAVDDPRCADLVVPQRCNESHGLPMTERRGCLEPLPTRTPAAQWRHVGLDPGL